MSTWRKAKLIKKKSDDGYYEMMDHVQLGTEYMVDIESINITKSYNMPHGVFFHAELIQVDNDEWLPTELLSIEGE